MSLPAPTHTQAQLEAVLNRLAAQPPAQAFARLLFKHDGSEAFAGLTPARLAELAREAFDFIAAKPPGQHKVRVRPIPGAEDGGERGPSVLEVANDDMPFLVDSILAELQARGQAVLALWHPIFKTERDKSGQLRRVLGAGDAGWNDGHQESYIAVLLPALSVAAAKEIETAISAILAEVRLAVSDWGKMRARLETAVAALESAPGEIPGDLLRESLAFLRWLEEDNFTFLGMREFEITGDPDNGALLPLPGTELGVLRDSKLAVLRRGSELVSLTPEIRRFFFAPAPLIITKANVVSR